MQQVRLHEGEGRLCRMRHSHHACSRLPMPSPRLGRQQAKGPATPRGLLLLLGVSGAQHGSQGVDLDRIPQGGACRERGRPL